MTSHDNRFEKVINGGPNPYRHPAQSSEDDRTTPVSRSAKKYPSNLETGNLPTAGAYATLSERQAAMTAGTVILAIGGLVVLGMLIALLVMVSHANERSSCRTGEHCHRFGLIDNTGTCDKDGQCIGHSRGQCSAWMEEDPEDCRPLTYGWTVGFYNLPNFTLCWHELCVYGLGAGLSHDWICPADDGVPSPLNVRRYELKERGNKRCLDYVQNDEDRAALESLATCIEGEPVCLFTYRDAGYTILHPVDPPSLVLGPDSDMSTLPEPNQISYQNVMVDAYHTAKAEIDAQVADALGPYAQASSDVEHIDEDADA